MISPFLLQFFKPYGWAVIEFSVTGNSVCVLALPTNGKCLKYIMHAYTKTPMDKTQINPDGINLPPLTHRKPIYPPKIKHTINWNNGLGGSSEHKYALPPIRIPKTRPAIIDGMEPAKVFYR